MLTLFACSFGSGEPTTTPQKQSENNDKSVPVDTKNNDKSVPVDTKSKRAVVGDFKVTVPKGTHTVIPADMGSDYNVYPAENGVMLQGIASGPIGNHKSGMFWVAGVHAHDVEDGPSHLEAVLVYPVECDDCPGEEVTTVKIKSSKGTKDKAAQLMLVRSMEIVDLDKDGTFEALLDVRFRPCCEGDDERFPYTELIVLKVQGDKIERWWDGEVMARSQ